jgi:hypothetical protein
MDNLHSYWRNGDVGWPDIAVAGESVRLRMASTFAKAMADWPARWGVDAALCRRSPNTSRVVIYFKNMKMRNKATGKNLQAIMD